jgi:hypothetical protein
MRKKKKKKKKKNITCLQNFYTLKFLTFDVLFKKCDEFFKTLASFPSRAISIPHGPEHKV